MILRHKPPINKLSETYISSVLCLHKYGS